MMRRSLQTVSERDWFTLWGVPSGNPKTNDSRTAWRRSLYAAAASLVAILAISLLTIVTIVLVVTTLAGGGPGCPDNYGSGDSAGWSRWSSSPDIQYGNNGTASYAALVAWDDAAEDRLDTTYVAAWMSDE